MDFWGVLILLVGLLLTASALLNARWLMNTRRSRFMSHFITEFGTRIFYMATGIAIITIAILRGFA